MDGRESAIEARKALYAEAFVATQTAANEAAGAFLRAMQAALARAGTPEALLGPGALHHLGRAIHDQAQMIACRDAFLIVAVVFLCSAIRTWFLNRLREG